MEVREATPSDAGAIRRVHRESIEGLGPAAYSQEQVDAWARGCESADYTAAIESDGFHFVVAEDGGSVVGFGSLRLEPPVEHEAAVDAEVTAVYVHPSAARDGVGTELLTTLEREARERGIGAIGLSASLNAVPFYERHGYERVREYAHEFSGDLSTGVEGRVVEMEKRL